MPWKPPTFEMWRAKSAASLRFYLCSQGNAASRPGLSSWAQSEVAPWFSIPGAGRRILSTGISSAASLQEDDFRGDAGSSELHREIISALDKLRTPETALVHSFLQHCSTPTDVELAVGALTRLRTLKAAQSNQRSNLREFVAELFAQACVRAEVPNTALKALWMHNLYGFTPSLKVAHLLLVYAKERKNVKFMQEVLRTMVANNLLPTAATADIAFRILNEAGESELLFKIAKEFHLNGIVFSRSAYDICISSAANAGQVNHVLKVQKWRQQHNIPHTTASTFAIAKALLLRRRPQNAVSLLHEQCPDNEKRAKYLTSLVRVWPEQLSQKKRFKKAVLPNLQKDTSALVNGLSSHGWRISISPAEEFGKGKAAAQKQAAEGCCHADNF